MLHCFDRVVLFGTYKAIGWPGAMGRHLHERGVRLLDYPKDYANTLRREMAQRVKAVAAEEGLAVIQVNAGQRKEALVEEILARRGRRPGLTNKEGVKLCTLHSPPRTADMPPDLPGSH